MFSISFVTLERASSKNGIKASTADMERREVLLSDDGMLAASDSSTISLLSLSSLGPSRRATVYTSNTGQRLKG